MKRLTLVLIALLAAGTLLAGEGKGCDMKNRSAKSVELTGTLVRVDGGEEGKTVFRVADSDRTYSVCHKTGSDVLGLANSNATVRIKGKVVSCGDGEELMISEAKKI